MMKLENFPVGKIYVPIERRKTLDPARVAALAESMLKDGQQTPIKVRAGLAGDKTAGCDGTRSETNATISGDDNPQGRSKPWRARDSETRRVKASIFGLLPYCCSTKRKKKVPSLFL